MAKFETPCQIVSLFVGAGVVAVLIIMFLNAEVRHRDIENEMSDAPVNIEDETGEELNFYHSILNRISSSLRFRVQLINQINQFFQFV